MAQAVLSPTIAVFRFSMVVAMHPLYTYPHFPASTKSILFLLFTLSYIQERSNEFHHGGKISPFPHEEWLDN